MSFIFMVNSFKSPVYSYSTCGKIDGSYKWMMKNRLYSKSGYVSNCLEADDFCSRSQTMRTSR
jgi:hypothetical protein